MRSSVPPETAERRQQLRQSDGVDVRYIPDVYVQIAADYDRALVNDQCFKYISKLDEKCAGWTRGFRPVNGQKHERLTDCGQMETKTFERR